MSDILILVLLFAVGAAALILEVFIPSHGVLTVAALGFLGAAVYQTFQHVGRDAGIISVIACGVLIPTFSFLAVKYWRGTWIGRKIVPLNPVASRRDSSVPVERISALIGQVGRSVSPLRPVGICEFQGQRVSCVAQFGVIEAGVEVEGVGIEGANLAVATKNG